MLKHLYLRNYALFSETHIGFQGGLNILTGETGAGKSLLVGALGLIMGKRADNNMVFLDDDKCIVEARFAHLAGRTLAALAAFDDFELEDDELIIRREIRTNGKSRAFINDTPVSLQVLKDVSALLVDMHSQHESQLLLSHDRQLELLDAFAENEGEVARFAAMLRTCSSLREQIRRLEQQELEARRQQDYYRHQVEELQRANLRGGEEAELEAELNLLQHAEDVREALGTSAERLYQQDDSIYSQLSSILDSMARAVRVSPQLGEEAQRLEEAKNIVKEAAFSFRQMLDAIESDPERLAFIEERLGLYHTLKLKYGRRSGAELVELYQEVLGKIEEFDSLEERTAALRAQLAAEEEGLCAQGLLVEQRRQAARQTLEAQVMALLQEVGFRKVRFEIAIERNVDAAGSLDIDGQAVRPLPSGINRVYFLIQPNPGMPAGPLSQIASGGEISRIMLAIKTALADKFSFPVLIFDEIDTGISGEIAHKVGLVMQKLGGRFQILSITHLPQIAAKGGAHFEIRKEVRDERTVSTIAQLDKQARIMALAQMISGDQPTSAALRNAEELLAQEVAE
ncbi:MAG: DNA repair protein RecN [Bacteroidia bacterium]